MRSKDHRPESLSHRMYRWLLFAYPKGFRERFGDGMRHAFASESREARREGKGAFVLFWFRSASQALVFGLGERLSVFGWSGGQRRNRHRKRKGEQMSETARDVRHALRRLMRSPGFSFAAIVTLALGIGANAAIFSLVHGVVLSPLPYPESDRLVTLWHTAPGAEIPRMDLSHGTYFHYRQHNRMLEDIAIYRAPQVTLTDEGEPTQVDGALVTHSFFKLLLARPPARGRVLTEEDDKPDSERVAVVSHRLWRQRYGADPNIMGRSINLSGTSYQIVGVMPQGFEFPSRETDLWVPLRLDPERVRLGGFSARGIGRLKPGITVADAQADLESLIPRLEERFSGRSYEFVVEQGKLSPRITPLKESLVGDVTRMLWILLGTVGFVLLIACANVANLFLVRAEGRRREVAIRTALGAGRGPIVRHFLSESALLGLLGGAVGLLLSYVGVRTLVLFGPENLPRLHEVAIGTTVLAFTAALSVLAGLAFGVIPLLRTGSLNLVTSLKDGGRGATRGRERHRTRSLLVVSQIALALVLLIGAGLMVKSFWQLKNVNPGFQAEGTLTFRISLPSSDYPDRETAARFHQQLIDHLSGLPGVRSVGAVSCLPLTGCRNVNPLLREGMHLEPGESPPAVYQRGVAPGYFRAMGIPLLAGRAIERSDHEQRTGAVVVSRTLAERFWPNESAIGKRVYPTVRDDPAWYTIVGVVDDVHFISLTEAPAEMIYFPMVGTDGPMFSGARSLAYVVQTGGAPLGLAGPIRNAVWELDPNLPVADLRTVESIVARAEAPMAFAMLLLGIAATVALTLGLVGVYSVLSYIVSQRKSEIGVRIALGAQAGDVRRMILRQGLGVAVLGVAIGLAGALALTQLMGGLLFNVQPTDLVTYFGVSLALFLVALLASYFPARRASRQDPIEALRSE